MARGERWELVRSGITDPDEVHRYLERGSARAAARVVEHTVALREQLDDESAVPRS